MKDLGTPGLVIVDGMVLGVEVGVIVFARGPENVKLTLGYAVLDPVKAHVDGI